jgi:hypothetical protein
MPTTGLLQRGNMLRKSTLDVLHAPIMADGVGK